MKLPISLLFACVLFIALVFPVSADASLVQNDSATQTNASSLNWPVTFAATPTVDNLILIGGYYSTEARTAQGISGSDNWNIAVDANVFLAWKIASASETTDYTFNLNGGSRGSWFTAEYSGIDVDPLDRVASNTSDIAATAVSAGTTAETTVANQLLIAVIGVYNTTGGGWSWTNDFMHRDDISYAEGSHAWADRQVSEIATYETTGMWTTERDNLQGLIATFILAEAEPTPTPTPTPTATPTATPIGGIPTATPIIGGESPSGELTVGIEPQLLLIILNILFMVIAIIYGGLFFWLIPLVLSILLFITSGDSMELRYFALVMMLAQGVGSYTTLHKGNI
jgi:hypothetical protein